MSAEQDPCAEKQQARLKQQFHTLVPMLVKNGKTEEEASTIVRCYIDIHDRATAATPAKHGGQLLILDVDADPNETLLNAALPTTTVIRYDSSEETAEELTQMIRIAHLQNQKPFTNIALATHAGETWQICSDVLVPMNGALMQAIAVAQPVLGELASVVAKQEGRIDLLGCNILDEQPQFVQALENLYGVNFAASDDKTGNMCGGGNWVLESDGIDVAATYFDRKELQKFKGNLGWGSWFMNAADMIPIVGTVARTTQATVLLATGDTEGAKSAMTDAAFNLAGDAVGLVSGGSGKVAMAAARAGAKVIVKQGAKAAAKKAIKAAAKKLTKKAMKKYAKKYFKKKIKSAAKKQAKELRKKVKETIREELVEFLSEATGSSRKDINALGKDQLNELLNAVADTDYCEK